MAPLAVTMYSERAELIQAERDQSKLSAIPSSLTGPSSFLVCKEQTDLSCLVFTTVSYVPIVYLTKDEERSLFWILLLTVAYLRSYPQSFIMCPFLSQFLQQIRPLFCRLYLLG